MVHEFRNEPPTDFSKPDNRRAMDEALALVQSRLGAAYAMVIDGRRVTAPETFVSLNPSQPSEVIGIFPKGGTEHVDRAVDAAVRAFETWRFVSADRRADVLFRAAAEIRRRKFEFNAWLTLEVGKTWPEADADTAETIDFLEFYGREMLRYAAEQPLTPSPGERNRLTYLPLGAGAVIPPWNFPLAILAGMTSAAVVTGNTVVLKPASDAPVIAYKFVEVLESSGLPPGVVNLLTGSGEKIGDPLVAHPKIRFVTFTGSKEVGLRINELAAKPKKGQLWIKRVVAEMGGKDSIIVDREADLDAAVEGVAVSAFGYQGQKCSACSRAIVDRAVYDEFVARLADRVKKIVVGPAKDPASGMGPVVSMGALSKVVAYLNTGKQEGRLVAGGRRIPGEAYFIEPTVFADVAPDARIAQEEIFGPILAVIPATDYDEALAIANNTEFGLTGAVYTKNRAKIEKASRLFHVGNLYFNRKCTGALVGRHPFGGFNLSGTDSKAGGRDYLLLFLQAKTTAEKL